MSKSLKEKMMESLKEETLYVEDRFARAELLFSDAKKSETEQIKEKPNLLKVEKSKFATKSCSFTENEIKFIKEVVLDFAKNGSIVTYSEVIRMAVYLLKEREDRLQLLEKIVRSKS